MSKVNIKIKFNDKIKYNRGILNENELIYYEDKTRVKIYKEKSLIIMERKDLEKELFLNFSKSLGIIKMKEGEFSFKIKVYKESWDKNKIILVYKIEDKISFELEYEVC